MSRQERKHIVYALAVYICVMATRRGRFTYEIDITNIAQELGASYSEQLEAHTKAREILRDFAY